MAYSGATFYAARLVDAAVAAITTDCSSQRDPDVDGALEELRARLSRWFTAGFADRRIAAARRKIAATTLSRAREASASGGATELSRWLRVAAVAGCDVDGKDFSEAVHSLVTKCDVLLGEGRPAEAHAALTRVEAGFASKQPASSWQAARQVIDHCLAVKGVRVPDEGGLWKTFARAGFIPLPEHDKAGGYVFEVTVSLEHGRLHEYGDGLAVLAGRIPSLRGSNPPGASRYDSRAKITGELRDSDGTRQFVIKASGFELAPDSLKVRMEHYKEVPGSSRPTQEDIDADARRLGINDLCEQLTEKLAAPGGQ